MLTPVSIAAGLQMWQVLPQQLCLSHPYVGCTITASIAL